MIDANSPVKSTPRIDKALFVKVLANAGSPWAVLGGSLWNLIASKGHDPAFWLAICGREHSFGTNKDSVLWRNNTQSWTNARTVRDPEVKKRATIITDAVRHSEYVKYQVVSDSLIDGCYRLDDPTFAYQQAGATTIGAVLAIWTEAEAAEYTAFVVDKMNEWQQTGGAMAGDDPRFEYRPDGSEFGYPTGQHGRAEFSIDLGVQHFTAGTDSLQYLLEQHGSSSHYLTWKNGKPRAQMIPEADAAWTGGSREYNCRGLHLEKEKMVNDPWLDEEVRELARTWAPIATRNNLPPVYLGRDNGAGKRGFIGHRDIPDGSGGWGGSSHHSDPGGLPDGGPEFPWDAFIGYLKAEMAGGVIIPPDDVLILPGNPNGDIPIVRGFRQYLLELAKARYPQDTNAAILSMVGYPSKPEYLAKDGNVYLPCERTILQFTPGNAPPFDIVMLRREDEPPEAA